MYKVLICDDDKNYISEIKEMLLECNGDVRDLKFYEYHSGEELLKKMPEDADVLFLDIQMKGMDGNETAVLLRERNYRGILIQCSGIFNPTPQTVVISPYRYLLKHDSRGKTMSVLGEILDEMDRQKTCSMIFAKYQREEVLLQPSDVVFFSRHRKGSEVHLVEGLKKKYPDGPVISPFPLELLADQLRLVGFAIPHNSYLVNLRYVDGMVSTEGIIRIGDEVFTISRSREKKFMSEFMRYINQKYKEKN